MLDHSTISADIGRGILSVVNSAKNEIGSLILSLDISQLPSVDIIGLDCCDFLPRIPCLYFLRHPSHGLLYVGKAKNLQSRWRAFGDQGGYREAVHQHHQRCLEIGNISLSWLGLDQLSHGIAETVAIQSLDPAWNISAANQNRKVELTVPFAVKSNETIPRIGRSLSDGERATVLTHVMALAGKTNNAGRTAMVILLGLSGLGPQEICDARCGRLNIQKGTLSVARKTVNINPVMMSWLLNFTIGQRGDSPLLRTSRGKKIHTNHFGRAWLRLSLRWLGRKCKFKELSNTGTKGK